MGLSVAHGVITEPGATGNQVIDLSAKPGWTAGDTPKAIVTFWTPLNAEGFVDHYVIGFGMAVWNGAATQYVYGHTSADAGATTNMSSHAILNLLGELLNPGLVTADAAFALVDADVDEFTINWTNLSTLGGTKITYLALGGDAITDAAITDWIVPAATGAADITIGFQPDLILCVGPGREGPSDFQFSSSGGGLSFGVGVKDGGDHVGLLMETDGSSQPTVTYWQQAGLNLGVNTSSPSTENIEVALNPSSGWPADGFEINVINAPVDLNWCVSLSLAGTFEAAVEHLDTPTTAGDVDHDPGFPVKAALLFGGNVTPAAGTLSPRGTDAQLGQFWFGLTDGATQSCHGGLIEDNRTGANTRSHYDEDYALRMKFADDASDLVSATPSFPGGVFRMTYDLAGTSFEYVAVLLGEAEGGEPPPSGAPIILHSPGLRW